MLLSVTTIYTDVGLQSRTMTCRYDLLMADLHGVVIESRLPSLTEQCEQRHISHAARGPSRRHAEQC